MCKHSYETDAFSEFCFSLQLKGILRACMLFRMNRHCIEFQCWWCEKSTLAKLSTIIGHNKQINIVYALRKHFLYVTLTKVQLYSLLVFGHFMFSRCLVIAFWKESRFCNIKVAIAKWTTCTVCTIKMVHISVMQVQCLQFVVLFTQLVT